MKVEFLILMDGFGATVEEAWPDAVQRFKESPQHDSVDYKTFCDCGNEVAKEDIDENGECKACRKEKPDGH